MLPILVAPLCGETEKCSKNKTGTVGQLNTGYGGSSEDKEENGKPFVLL